MGNLRFGRFPIAASVGSSSLLLSSLELSDTQVYEPEIRARLGTAAHFCKVVRIDGRSRAHQRLALLLLLNFRPEP